MRYVEERVERDLKGKTMMKKKIFPFVDLNGWFKVRTILELLKQFTIR